MTFPEDSAIILWDGECTMVKGTIFNIQKFCVNDGPGIRTTVFLKGCPLRCLWCHNPESNRAVRELFFDGEKCSRCGRCAAVCPNGVHLVTAEGHDVLRDRCASCGACVKACLNDALETVGYEITVEDALKEVSRDELFYKNSGGGMTVSGGECLLYPDFTEALLFAAHEVGLHTAVESCCFASREVVDRVFAHVDLAMIDIKHMNSALHKKYTGVPNEPILANIRHVYHELKVPMMISLPTIPGYNDDEINIAATAKFVARELGSDVPIRLLPYHRLGESKNESLGRKMDMTIPVPTDEFMQSRKALVESFGLTAQIGG